MNIARFTKTDPETALHKSCEKFIRRFNYVEQEAERSGGRLSDMSLEEMDKLWEQSKKSEQNE